MQSHLLREGHTIPKASRVVSGVVGIVLLYGLWFGGKWFAVIRADFVAVSLLFLISGLITWGMTRRTKVSWHQTPFDTTLLLWLVSIAISLMANWVLWRKSGIGIWQLGLYVLIGVALFDLIARRVISHRLLRATLLIAGAGEVVFGLLQTTAGLQAAPSIADFVHGLLVFRPAGLFANPNWLASFLVILLPFVAASVVTARSARSRILFALYFASALLLLLLTFSRGAWIAAAAGAAGLTALHATSNTAFSWQSVRAVWKRSSRVARVTVGLILMVVVFLGLLFVSTFSMGGRTLNLRTGLWQPAIAMFRARPLTGVGPYLYGSQLTAYWEDPLPQLHGHAHNLALHVAAELGLPGLLVLAVAINAAVRATKTSHAVTRTLTPYRMAAMGALISLGVHQLSDVTLLLPSIAFAAVIVTVLTTSSEHSDVVGSTRQRIQGPLLTGISVLVVATGVWNNNLHAAFDATIQHASTSSVPVGKTVLDALNHQIEADPYLAITRAQHALLLGIEAANGDSEDIDRAIGAYETLVALEPAYAPSWANLSALYGQAGRLQDAIAAGERAARLAPDSAALWFRLAVHYDTTNQLELAHRAYDRAIHLSPAIVGSSLWNATPLQRSLHAASQRPTEASTPSRRQIIETALRDSRTLSPMVQDYDASFYMQYLRMPLPRQFLPQVSYFPNA